MSSDPRPLALVTGASSGIGRELAMECARHGFDLLIAADTPLGEVVAELREFGESVEMVETDLSTIHGVDEVYAALGGRSVDALLANTGHGLGRAFLDQDFAEARHAIDTNITGTIYLVQLVARDMVAAGVGRILITGSIAGFMPGTFQAVYNGSKAFIDSFSWALRNELTDSGVTVTCLMPGPTDTNFFARTDMFDTKLAQEAKMDPAEVARIGFEAMIEGEGDVAAGFKSKLRASLANVLPAALLAEQHRRMVEPDSARK